MEINISYFAFELTLDALFCSTTCLVFAFNFLSPLCTLAPIPLFFCHIIALRYHISIELCILAYFNLFLNESCVLISNFYLFYSNLPLPINCDVLLSFPVVPNKSLNYQEVVYNVYLQL